MVVGKFSEALEFCETIPKISPTINILNWNI
jgi:hypothetical protein